MRLATRRFPARAARAGRRARGVPAARAAFLACCTALAAIASRPGVGMTQTRPEILLGQGTSRESLRAILLSYSDSARATDPLLAGQAFYLAGLSYARASRRDSAIACFQRADSARGGDEERLALADALLMRRREGDLGATLALVEPAMAQARLEMRPAAEAFQARLAWAELLAGRGDRANELFRPLTRRFGRDPVWGYRMAKSFVEAGDSDRALAILRTLAVASRAQDEQIMDLAVRAFEPRGDRSRLEADIGREIAARDRNEGTVVQAIGGRRVRFRAADGYALGGVVVAPAGEKRRRAAVVLWSPRDTLQSYDSLTVALARTGWAVMLMEVRGSGWSAAPDCPFADSWAGREDAMQAACARDVREALRALSLVAKIDTTRYVVAGVGHTGPIALEAAELDLRVPALLLLSPAAAAVEGCTMRERVRRLQVPIYIATAPEDFPYRELTESLYQAGDRPRSRVADVRVAGSGARPFRSDTASVRRLVHWLNETVPEKARGRPRSGTQRAR